MLLSQFSFKELHSHFYNVRFYDMKRQKEFPEGMVPLGKSEFSFACHQGVACFTRCCHKLEIYLYPYDIIRLKNRLGMTSEEFLHNHCGVVQGANPCFPSVTMLMKRDKGNPCPFLAADGCTIYTDRPSACRMYPLERAVDRGASGHREGEYYFLTNHDYCQGHKEEKQWTVKGWVRDQNLLIFNQMEDLWTEMDTIFADSSIWQGEGAGGPRQQLAFMACYNIDRFRQYVNDNNILKQYRLDKSKRKLIEKDDEALLRFAFDWLKVVLAGKPALQRK